MKNIESRTYYTDGSCLKNPGSGGWAYVELVPFKDGYKTKIVSGGKSDTINNEMELTAAYRAILDAYKAGVKRVYIHADSAYVVNAIGKNWLRKWRLNGWETTQGTPVKNKTIWEKIYRLIFEKDMDVITIQVKGHSGNVLNELADSIARRESERIEYGNYQDDE